MLARHNFLIISQRRMIMKIPSKPGQCSYHSLPVLGLRLRNFQNYRRKIMHQISYIHQWDKNLTWTGDCHEANGEFPPYLTNQATTYHLPLTIEKRMATKPSLLAVCSQSIGFGSSIAGSGFLRVQCHKEFFTPNYPQITQFISHCWLCMNRMAWHL